MNVLLIDDHFCAREGVACLRETLYLPLDDLLYVTKTYINPDVSRSGLARRLKRLLLVPQAAWYLQAERCPAASGRRGRTAQQNF